MSILTSAFCTLDSMPPSNLPHPRWLSVSTGNLASISTLLTDSINGFSPAQPVRHHTQDTLASIIRSYLAELPTDTATICFINLAHCGSLWYVSEISEVSAITILSYNDYDAESCDDWINRADLHLGLYVEFSPLGSICTKGFILYTDICGYLNDSTAFPIGIWEHYDPLGNIQYHVEYPSVCVNHDPDLTLLTENHLPTPLAASDFLSIIWRGRSLRIERFENGLPNGFWKTFQTFSHTTNATDDIRLTGMGSLKDGWLTDTMETFDRGRKRSQFSHIQRCSTIERANSYFHTQDGVSIALSQGFSTDGYLTEEGWIAFLGDDCEQDVLEIGEWRYYKNGQILETRNWDK